MKASRRSLLFSSALGLGASLFPGKLLAFGEEGAFHARLLSPDEKRDLEEELSAARRWAWELTRRTSAPGRLAAQTVAPQSSSLLKEPFVVWAGNEPEAPLSVPAIRQLRTYLRMGGILVVDERGLSKTPGAFLEGARKEMARVLPESGIVRLPRDHVLYKSFYILDQPLGRRRGPDYIEAIVRGNDAQVLFLNHDLLGALSRVGESFRRPMEEGNAEAREHAIRFAVNIAMYVLCSDYKDDQVHAPFLMRRRHGRK